MTHDEFIADEIERLRATCDDLESNLQSDLAERGSAESAGQLRTFRSLVQGRVTSAKNLQARAVTAKTSAALMRELAEEIRRIEAIQSEIDRRLTLY